MRTIHLLSDVQIDSRAQMALNESSVNTQKRPYMNT